MSLHAKPGCSTKKLPVFLGRGRGAAADPVGKFLKIEDTYSTVSFFSIFENLGCRERERARERETGQGEKENGTLRLVVI